jgi:hypothetical protein
MSSNRSDEEPRRWGWTGWFLGLGLGQVLAFYLSLAAMLSVGLSLLAGATLAAAFWITGSRR